MGHARAGELELLEKAVQAARADHYRLNVVNYTAIANAHAEHGQAADAFLVLGDMRRRHVAPTDATLRVASKAAMRVPARQRAVLFLRETLSWVRRSGASSCTRAWNQCLRALITRGGVDDALDTLNDVLTHSSSTTSTVTERARGVSASSSSPSSMPVPDACSFNQIITALGRAHRLKDALLLFGRMLMSPVAPDVVTYNAVLAAALEDVAPRSAPWSGNGGGGERAEQQTDVAFVSAVQRSMARRGVGSDATTETLMLRLLSRRGFNDVDAYAGADAGVAGSGGTTAARSYAEETSRVARKLVQRALDSAKLRDALDKPFFDAALTALGLAGDVGGVASTFDAMLRRSVRPDALTLRALLVGASAHGDVGLARVVLAASQGLGAAPDEHAFTTAIATCARATPCDAGAADEFLSAAAEAGVGWTAPLLNAAISSRGADASAALALWKRLQDCADAALRNVLEDHMVYCALFRACGRAARPDLALRVWYAAKNARHLLPNSHASCSVFNALMRGARERERECGGESRAFADNLFGRNYLRLLRTECGVRDDIDWPIERIRIKF